MTHRALVVLLVLLAVLAGPAAAQFAVGTADVTLLDPARNDRPVPCDLFYPAILDGPGQPPATPAGDGFAAVALGHGYLMSADVYGFLAADLARIGCVVAVPRTAGELFPDHAEFGLDLAFVARTLRDADADPASPFHERMNGRALLMGHSMGGGASLLGLAGDPTLTGVANFAAAETDPSAIAACAGIDRPALLLAGANDCVAPPADHQVPMYDALPGGWRTLVVLDGASHCQFAEASFVCSLGEFCSADISRTVQHDRMWFLLEPWVRAVGLGEVAQGSAFQERLTGADWLSYEQAGVVTAAPVVPRPGLRLAAAPNPFNPTTTVSFSVDRGDQVRLDVLDARGRRLRTLVAGWRDAGEHRATWDGRDGRGRPAATGTYLLRLQAGASVRVAKMVLVE
ncbi:MAG: FlgD immunoglobulin-like domain containing protein [Candidatus Krumholzibacteriia bacterium]